MTSKGAPLWIDAIRCRAHGLCAEELPEAITLDEWGYPILPNGPLPIRPGSTSEGRRGFVSGTSPDSIQPSSEAGLSMLVRLKAIV